GSPSCATRTCRFVRWWRPSSPSAGRTSGSSASPGSCLARTRRAGRRAPATHRAEPVGPPGPPRVAGVAKEAKYRRILLKLSGEALMGPRQFGLDPDMVRRIAEEIREVHGLGVQVAMVIGGGNIYRGLAAESEGVDRVTGDHMGMLATVINSLAVQDALEKVEVHTRVL